MPTKVNGIAVAAIGAGTIFVWSGIKGWSVSGVIGDIVRGAKPQGSEIYTLSSGDNSSSGSNPPVGPVSGIAADALQYQGHSYLYGGAPGRNGTHAWDCSSFVNWVVGHDERMAIPGMRHYDGSSHGPPTGSWAVWPGLKHISRSQLQAGDIIVYVGHMGIAISNDRMISALNSSLGTRISGIDGVRGNPIVYGRL